MKSIIGLHIDSAFVNAAQLDNRKGQARIIKAAAEEIKLKEGADADTAISSALKAVLSKFSLGNASIICTFHDPQIFVRKITTPPMPLQELRPAVQLAVKNAFPFSLDEAVFDFQLANKFSQQGKERYNVLAAVAPIKTMERIKTIFSNAKIRVDSCIPVAIALENLISRTKPKADETLAVILLGPAATEMAIYQDSHLQFSRKLSMAVEDITKSMTGSFFSDTGKTELSFGDAQALLKEFGIPKPDEEVQVNEKIASQQILMLIGPKIEQLATEINRSLDYFREELQGGKVDRVLLVGEISRIKRLDEFLTDQLGLEVTCGNPLEGMGADNASQQQILSVGAALTGAQGINLLSKGPGNKNTPNISTGIMTGLVIAIIAVLSVVYLYLSGQIQDKSEQAGLKAQQFTSRLTEARDIHRLKEGRALWGEILNVFSDPPHAIYLDELNLNNDQLSIKGSVLGEGKDPKATLTDFISNLQKSPLKDVRLKSLTKAKEEDDKFNFEIVAGTTHPDL